MRDKIVPRVWFLATSVRRSELAPVRALFPFVWAVHRILGYMFCNDLSTNVELKGIPIFFHGFGIIVGSGCVIGEDVVFRSGVVVGESRRGKCDAPRIGSGVEFGVGAMVFGDTDVPDNARVRAGSVFS